MKSQVDKKSVDHLQIVWTIFEIIVSWNCVVVNRIFYVYMPFDAQRERIWYPVTWIRSELIKFCKSFEAFEESPESPDSQKSEKSEKGWDQISEKWPKAPLKRIDDHSSRGNRYWSHSDLWSDYIIHSLFGESFMICLFDGNYYGFHSIHTYRQHRYICEFIWWFSFKSICTHLNTFELCGGCGWV